MADCAEVVPHALTIPELRVSVLVPNLRYAERGVRGGRARVHDPGVRSEPHSIANIRKTHDEIFADLRAIVALRDARFPAIGSRGLATAFGCTIQGVVPEDDVFGWRAGQRNAGVDSIHPADTVGFASPTQVRRLFPRLRAEVGDQSAGAHLHNTRGQGLANVVAALDVGIPPFDSSHGGLGGCPYAPGPPATSSPRISCSCSKSMGLAPASISTG